MTRCLLPILSLLLLFTSLPVADGRRKTRYEDLDEIKTDADLIGRKDDPDAWEKEPKPWAPTPSPKKKGGGGGDGYPWAPTTGPKRHKQPTSKGGNGGGKQKGNGGSGKMNGGSTKKASKRRDLTEREEEELEDYRDDFENSRRMALRF